MFNKYSSIILFVVVSFFSLQSQSDSNIWTYIVGKVKSSSPVNNELYLEECGACHLAYHPGLLPSRSWIRLMNPNELLNHFDEDISFDEAPIYYSLINYLITNSADQSSHRRSRKILRSIEESDMPIRISDTRYIRRKHHEIPKDLITQKEVGSLSNCGACHRSADDASFDDDNVRVPNSMFRLWDDD
jgi:hypothetical protein